MTKPVNKMLAASCRSKIELIREVSINTGAPIEVARKIIREYDRVHLQELKEGNRIKIGQSIHLVFTPYVLPDGLRFKTRSGIVKKMKPGSITYKLRSYSSTAFRKSVRSFHGCLCEHEDV